MKSLLAWLTAGLIRALGSTLRLTMEDRAGILHRPECDPVIIAFWHNRTMLMPLFQERYRRGREIVTLISRSRDGQFMTDVAARFGIRAARGSSSRHGAAAALSAIHAADDRKVDLAITPDGPRGPRYQIQPGLLRLAQVTGRPIVAMTYRLGWKYELPSWDRFQVALPFSSCHLAIQAPIFVPQDATEGELEKISKRVTEALGGDEF
jgi:lysophospholipid acyltransferase (LPLAT)-like uncharacterized protein